MKKCKISSDGQKSDAAKKSKLTFLESLNGLKVLTEMDATMRCQAIATIVEHTQVTIEL